MSSPGPGGGISIELPRFVPTADEQDYAIIAYRPDAEAARLRYGQLLFPEAALGLLVSRRKELRKHMLARAPHSGGGGEAASADGGTCDEGNIDGAAELAAFRKYHGVRLGKCHYATAAGVVWLAHHVLAEDKAAAVAQAVHSGLRSLETPATPAGASAAAPAALEEPEPKRPRLEAPGHGSAEGAVSNALVQLDAAAKKLRVGSSAHAERAPQLLAQAISAIMQPRVIGSRPA